MKIKSRFRVGFTFENIYLAILFVYGFLDIITKSLIGHPGVLKPVMVLGTMLCGLIYCVSRHDISLKKIIVSAVVLFSFLVAGAVTKRLYVCFFGVLLICADVTSFRKITITTLCATMPAMLFVIACSQVGIIPDYIFDHNGRVAHSFGYSYYSTMPYIFMFNISGYMYIRKNKMRWYEMGVILFLVLLVEHYTTLRLSFYLSILEIVMYILLVKKEIMNLNKKWIQTLALCLFPVTFWWTYYAAQHYTVSSKFWREMNEILSNRLTLSHDALNLYSVKLLGQYIQMKGNSYNKINYYYFYIDSGYIYSLLGYGLLFTVILIGLYSYLTYISCKENEKELFIWLCVIALFTIANNTWVSLSYNPPLLATMIFFINRPKKQALHH